MSPTHPPTPFPFLPDVLQIALLDYFVFTPVTFTARLLLVQKLSGLDIYIYDLVPKGVHENKTKGVENKVDDTLKLVVFLECAQC